MRVPIHKQSAPTPSYTLAVLTQVIPQLIAQLYTNSENVNNVC